MGAVQDLFLRAAAVVPEVVATQAAAATRGMAAATGAAAEALFDDDLDVGSRAPATARWVKPGGVTPAAALHFCLAFAKQFESIVGLQGGQRGPHCRRRRLHRRFTGGGLQDALRGVAGAAGPAATGQRCGCGRALAAAVWAGA